jgi:hypothetical protein
MKLDVKRIIKIISKYLNNENEEIILKSAKMIERILFLLNEKEKENKSNSLYLEMEKDGLIAKLIELILNDNIKNKEIKDYSSIIIGYLYKGIELPIEY